MASLAELEQRLQEAENAAHEIAIGGGVVEVRWGSNRNTRFTEANLDKLHAYIDRLKDQIAVMKGEPRRMRPVRFTF